LEEEVVGGLGEVGGEEEVEQGDEEGEEGEGRKC
jgi:hypothetical protein